MWKPAVGMTKHKRGLSGCLGLWAEGRGGESTLIGRFQDNCQPLLCDIFPDPTVIEAGWHLFCS